MLNIIVSTDPSSVALAQNQLIINGNTGDMTFDTESQRLNVGGASLDIITNKVDVSLTNVDDNTFLNKTLGAVYTYSQTDLQSGTSALESGKLYFVYE